MYSFALLLVVALLCFGSLPTGYTQEKTAVAKYEFALVKWDGPDRIYYNLPGKFELVFLSKVGVQVPRDAQPEEWCLTYAANVMAKDGWEAVNLNSRRILFRRAK